MGKRHKTYISEPWHVNIKILSWDSEINMNAEEKEKLKKKILIVVVRSRLPMTPNRVSEEMGILCPTASNFLFELALEGHLEMVKQNGFRYFKPAPIKQGLEVIRR